VRQQVVSHQTTGYIDLLSLAQSLVATHQECKSQSRADFMFSRVGVRQLRKTCTRYLAVFAGWISHIALISTASSETLYSQCGFGWKLRLPCPVHLFSHTVIRSQALFFTACVR
jgi:hypothetical protein